MMQSSEGAWVDPVEGIMYEHMLLLRVATQGVAPYGRSSALERSATVLLARLEAGGAMSIAELAEAFDLDVSTVHRQVAAAMKAASSGWRTPTAAPPGCTVPRRRDAPASPRS